MTLDELVTPLTYDQAKAAIYAAVAARGIAATTWKPGAIARTLIAAFAVLVVAVSTLQSLITKSGFLGLAKGDWLTAVAKYVYGVDRELGSFASGNISASNATGFIYSGVAGDLVVKDTATGKTYRNTASFTIGALASGVVIPVQAIELGTASNAAAAAVDALVTTLAGVTVTNPAAIIGSDPEDDTALELRCREKTGTLSPNGPRDAYAYFARTATRADGTPIGVTRVATIADGAGDVDVYVATASGGVTGAVGALTTDLGRIDDAIQKNVVPVCVTETTLTATALPIAVTYTLWLSSAGALTDAQIEAAVEAALIAFLSARPVGGDLLVGESTGRVYVSALEAVIGGAVSGVLRVTVSLPSADVDVTTTQAPVAGTLTGTIHQVAEGLL